MAYNLIKYINLCIYTLQGDPSAVYSKDENILRFQNVCVGTQEALSVGLHLHNIEHVPCPVIVTLGNGNSVFTVDPKSFTISSLCVESVNVSFKPPHIGVSYILCIIPLYI